MNTRGKLIIGALSAALVVVVVARVWAGLEAVAYFEGGRCTCGNDLFTLREKQGCLTYSPGHGIRPRCFHLQARGKEWDLLAAPVSLRSWPNVKPDDVVGRMRLENGAMYIAWNSSTNWTGHARLANPWRVWLGRVVE